MAHIIEKTNPLTGAVEYVDQLDHTAQQIDDGIARAFLVPGQDLLDNSVFLPGCLVDQRQGYVVPPGVDYYAQGDASAPVGTTTTYYKVLNYSPSAEWCAIDIGGVIYMAYTSAAVRGYTGVGYGIDRWVSESGGMVVKIEQDGITLLNQSGTAFYSQRLPEELGKSLLGKTVTISAIIDGSLVSAHGVLPTSPATAGYAILIAYGLNATVSIRFTSSGLMYFCITAAAGKSVKYKAAALNLGDHQTAFHQDADGNWQLNELPNYGEQLARCQYYCQRITGNVVLTGFVNGAGTRLTFAVPLTSPMRKSVPAISVSGLLYLKGPDGGGAVADYNFTVNDGSSVDNMILINLNNPDATKYKSNYVVSASIDNFDMLIINDL